MAMSQEIVSSAQSAFTTALWVVSAFFGTTIAAFCYKRELLPVRARPFFTTLAIFVCSWLYAGELCAQWIWVDNHPCILTFVVLWPQSVLVFNLFIIRAWLLWFHYKSTSEKCSLTSDLSTSFVSSEVHKCRWYLKNQHYASDAFLLKLYVSKTLFELAIVWSNLAANPSLATRMRSVDDVVCDEDGYTIWCYMLVIFYNAALCIFAAMHFDEVADGFGLKLELKRMGFLGMVGIFVWVLLTLLVEDDHDTFPYSSMWLVVVAVGVTVNSGVYPICRSYKMHQMHIKSLKARLIRNARDRCTADLLEWLSYAEARELFRRHLRLEFSVENLMFWEAVEEFRNEFKDDCPERNWELARRLANRFMSESAPLQVNLQYTVVNPILHGLGLAKNTQPLLGDTSSTPCHRGLLADCFAQGGGGGVGAGGFTDRSGNAGRRPLRHGMQPGDPNFTFPRSPSQLRHHHGGGGGGGKTPKLKVPLVQAFADSAGGLVDTGTVGGGMTFADTAGGLAGTAAGTVASGMMRGELLGNVPVVKDGKKFDISRTMFDESQEQVLELMASDSWVRFKIRQDMLMKENADAQLQSTCGRRMATRLHSVNAVEMVFVPESLLEDAHAHA